MLSRDKTSILGPYQLENLHPLTSKHDRPVPFSKVNVAQNDATLIPPAAIFIKKTAVLRETSMKARNFRPPKVGSTLNVKPDSFHQHLTAAIQIKSAKLPPQKAVNRENLFDKEDKTEKNEKGEKFFKPKRRQTNVFTMKNIMANTPTDVMPTEQEEGRIAREFRIKSTISGTRMSHQNGIRSLSLCEKTREEKQIAVETLNDEYDMLLNLNTYVNKDSDLSSFYLNIVSPSRASLPLLIMHFEGLLGTCNFYSKDDNFSDKLSRAGNFSANGKSENFVTRSGMKKELKALAKHFIIVVIFPSSAERYKTVMKSFLKSKLNFDGAYYINKQARDSKASQYLINYDSIVEDFKLRANQKTIIFKAFNITEKSIKEYIRQMVKEKDSALKVGNQHESSTFHNIFPKMGIRTERLKICLFPNFLLDEKNERCPLQAIHPKYSFKNLSDIAYRILHETATLGIMEIEDVSQENGSIVDTDETVGCSSASKCKQISIDHDSETSLEKIYIDQYSQNIDTPASKTSETFSPQRLSRGVGIGGPQYYKLDFKLVLGQIEEQTARNKFIDELQQIKKKNLHSGIRVRNFDLSSMKNRIIEDLLAQQRAKGITRNLMSYFVVGDLFARNNEMFRFYEKNEYYTHLKHTQNISDIQLLKRNNVEESETLSTNASSDQFMYLSFSSFLTVAKDNFQEFKKNIGKLEINLIKKYIKNFYICCEE